MRISRVALTAFCLVNCIASTTRRGNCHNAGRGIEKEKKKENNETGKSGKMVKSNDKSIPNFPLETHSFDCTLLSSSPFTLNTRTPP